MSFSDFLSKWRRRRACDGWSVVPRALREIAVRAPGKIDSLRYAGTNVLDRDWEILVVLDGCRLDMYRDVVNSNTDWIWSVASMSEEWMNQTFKRSTADVSYITANPFADRLDESEFAHLHNVWATSTNQDDGVVLPSTMVDIGIHEWRTGSHNRMILHLMQPHFPFIGGNDDRFHLGSELGSGENPWNLMKDPESELSFDDIRSDYWATLDRAWNSVSILLNNVNARVVVTADHGNDNGSNGVWGHRRGVLSPQTRMVPWDVYECHDNNTYIPDPPTQTTATSDVEDRLKALGYK